MHKNVKWVAILTALAVVGVGIGFFLSSSDPKVVVTTAPKPSIPPARAVTPARFIAVKVDNSTGARPQTGLQEAAIIYAEQVEGGISRFLALYETSHPLPLRVEPVRSARETDLPILAGYGKPVLVYSGAQSKLLPSLARASVVNVRDDAGGAQRRPFSRDASRAGTDHDLYVNLQKVNAVFKAGPTDRTGYRYGAAPAGGEASGSRSAHVGGDTFTFAPHKGAWAVHVNGGPTVVNAGTVIIQHVKAAKSPLGLHDFLGSPSPFTVTTGTGTAVVLRDGKAYNCQWSKANDTAPTTYTHNGKPIPFAAGQLFITLETP